MGKEGCLNVSRLQEYNVMFNREIRKANWEVKKKKRVESHSKGEHLKQWNTYTFYCKL